MAPLLHWSSPSRWGLKRHRLARCELEELRGAVGAAGVGAAGGFDDALRDHTTAEVPLVEGAAEDRFVNRLKVADGKLGGHETVGDVCVLQLVAQAEDGVVEHAGVVEGEFGQLRYGEPARLPDRLVTQTHALRVDEREVRDGDRLFATQPRERVELLEKDVVDAGLFEELAGRGLRQRLVRAQKTAGERPHALV